MRSCGRVNKGSGNVTPRESVSAVINMLSDPYDACDFEGDQVAALRATIQDALRALMDLRKELEST